jgi:hypothetical protein
MVFTTRGDRAGIASHQPPSIGIAQVEAIGPGRQRSIYRSVAAGTVAMQSDWHGNAYSVPLGEKASTAVIKWPANGRPCYPDVTRSNLPAPVSWIIPSHYSGLIAANRSSVNSISAFQKPIRTSKFFSTHRDAARSVRLGQADAMCGRVAGAEKAPCCHPARRPVPPRWGLLRAPSRNAARRCHRGQANACRSGDRLEVFEFRRCGRVLVQGLIRRGSTPKWPSPRRSKRHVRL